MTDFDILFESCNEFTDISKLSPIFRNVRSKGLPWYRHGYMKETKGIDELKVILEKDSNGNLLDPIAYKKAMDAGFIDSSGTIVEMGYRITKKTGFRACTGNLKSKSILALGCSDTFGSGNFNENTWPYIVSKELNFPVINGGVGGGSLTQCYKNLVLINSIAKLDTVMVLIPERTRELFFFQDKKDYTHNGFNMTSFSASHLPNGNSFQSSVSSEQQKELISFYHHSTLLDESVFLSWTRNLNAIENLCYKKGINLILMPNPSFYKEYYKDYCSKTLGRDFEMAKNYSKARDFMHLGADFQHDIAQYFIERYKTLKIVA
jgi:hypothetical protein